LSSWCGAAYARVPVSVPCPSRSPARSGFLLPWLLLLVCCAEAPPAEELHFRVGYPDLPSSLLIYVAQDARLFAAENLRVESRVFASGREGLLATIAGELDATAVYSTAVVLAAMNGEDVVALTTLHRSDGLTGLAVNRGANIQTAADLRGKRIGVTPGTSSQLALDVLLAEAGLDFSDIRAVPGQPRDLIAALEEGRLDAASLWVPSLLTATSDPGKARLLVSDVYTDMSMLVGLRPRIESRRTEAIRFLRALLHAQAMIRRRPGLIESTLRPRFSQLDENQLAMVIAHSRFELGLSNLLLTELRQEAAWLEQRGEKREGRVRIRDVVAPALLEELAPESVTLLRAPDRRLQ
jgi:ABC-type nitrate/sulfonate/bicarbonate transport system substrate-binding protein